MTSGYNYAGYYPDTKKVIQASTALGREEKKLLALKLSVTSSSSASSSAEALNLPAGGLSASSLGFTVSERYQRLASGAKSAKELPKLKKTFSGVPSFKGYSPMIRNQLAEQNEKSLNQTFAFGSRLAGPSFCQQPRRGRSSSIDSDFGDYSIHGALTGMFPTNIRSGIKSSLSNHIGRKSFSQGAQYMPASDNCALAHNLTAAATLWAKCAKLPSLEDCSPNRKCCQKQFASTRTQFELAKYKDTLKNKT